MSYFLCPFLCGLLFLLGGCLPVVNVEPDHSSPIHVASPAILPVEQAAEHLVNELLAEAAQRQVDFTRSGLVLKSASFRNEDGGQSPMGILFKTHVENAISNRGLSTLKTNRVEENLFLACNETVREDFLEFSCNLQRQRGDDESCIATAVQRVQSDKRKRLRDTYYSGFVNGLSLWLKEHERQQIKIYYGHFKPDSGSNPAMSAMLVHDLEVAIPQLVGLSVTAAEVKNFDSAQAVTRSVQSGAPPQAFSGGKQGTTDFDLLVVGTFSTEKNGLLVRIQVFLKDDTNWLIFPGLVLLPEESLPQSLGKTSVVPWLSSFESVSKAARLVNLSIEGYENTETPLFKSGESLGFSMTCSRPSHVYLFNIDDEGTVWPLFPVERKGLKNNFSSSWFPAQIQFRLPADKTAKGWGRAFISKRGLGKEVLVAFASPVPLDIPAVRQGKPFLRALQQQCQSRGLRCGWDLIPIVTSDSILD